MIYCRANHDSLTENLSNPYLKFIDSGNLTIKQLKRNVLDQPASFVCPDTKRGVATKPFKAMIVGFGETGYEAFSFLYEFSACIKQELVMVPHYDDLLFDGIKPCLNFLFAHAINNIA